MSNYKSGVISCTELICIREEPDMHCPPFAEIDNGTEIEVNTTFSNDKFCNICTAYGVEGYVLSKYVKFV